MKDKFEQLPKILFIFSLVASVYVYGVLSHKFNWIPFPQLRYAFDSAQLVIDEFGMVTRTKPDKHLFQSRYAGADVVRRDPEQMQSGLTLITSFFDDGMQIRLLAENGDVVNSWPVSVSGIWDNWDHILPEFDRPNSDWNVVFNGVNLLPDGSVVFPMFGLVKMDRCGGIVWKLPIWAHHSVERSPRGTFWTAGRHYVDQDSKHSPIDVPYEIDTIVEVSAQGEVLKEIAVLDVLWKNEMLALLFANNRDFDPNSNLDVVHLNDVEEIPTDRLGQFPMFEEGDLLVSLRQPNMVLVLDPDDERIKWFQIGPWIQQHDADWHSDGTIIVFDNGYDGSKDGMYFGGSNVVSVHPSSREISYLYGKGPGQDFYTSVQGDQQMLENGNILITESDSGRVIEVTPMGDVVWEYINRYSEHEVIRISDAIRYPEDYFDIDDWSCN